MAKLNRFLPLRQTAHWNNCAAVIALLTVTGLLTGCVTPGKHVVPKGGSLTMAKIYQQETGQDQGAVATATTASATAMTKVRLATVGAGQPVPLMAAPDSTAQVLKARFPSLPNPAIPVYVAPHLVTIDGERYPKPAYTTFFYLYRRNQFAMPGEATRSFS